MSPDRLNQPSQEPSQIQGEVKKLLLEGTVANGASPETVTRITKKLLVILEPSNSDLELLEEVRLWITDQLEYMTTSLSRADEDIYGDAAVDLLRVSVLIHKIKYGKKE
jgi:hypothetical protein